MKSNRLICTVLSLAFLLAACDKNETPPPAQTQQNNGGQPNYAMGNIEDPIPGTPINQVQNRQEVLQVLVQNLSGQGIATVGPSVSAEYALEMVYPAPQLRRLSNPVQTAVTVSSYQYIGKVYGGVWKGTFWISLYGSVDSGEFVLVDSDTVNGIQIYSTDQVAVFKRSQAYYDTSQILRVPFRGQNPQFQKFSFESSYYGSSPHYGGGGGPSQVRVVSTPMTTQLQYFQQGSGNYPPR